LENARTVVIRLFIHPPGLQNIKAQLRSQLARDQGAPTRARFDKFTERARKVLSLAQEEAQRFQHNYIGTEHLLLGLVREREGVAANALNNLDISLEKVRNAVEFIIGRGDRVVLGEVGLTPRAKKVIELAVDEARRLNHPYIGTEHILLGLVREGEGIAAGVLQSLGVKLDVLRTAILSILQQEETPDTSENLAPDETIHVLNAANVVHHVTKQALQTIQFADSERARLNYPTMCTEHLLLGLLHDEQSVTALVFKESGIELATIYPAIEALQEREEQAYPWSSEFTPLVRAMQDIAGHEALRLNSPLIGNEHLLLAILRFPESNAVKILQQLGADSTTLRSKLVERLQQS
jgi:ATP-dependent Clp protease ATP-binding subunit ClpA